MAHRVEFVVTSLGRQADPFTSTYMPHSRKRNER